MTQQNLDVSSWITRVQKAPDARALFSILKEFRALPWSDEERARMSKAYLRVLDRVGGPPAEENVAEPEQEKNDGPVWYEKM